jgi:hypothetical protein
MLVLVKTDNTDNRIEIGQTFFPRPAPWKISIHSTIELLRRHQTYAYVLIPPEWEGAIEYDAYLEDCELFLRQDAQIVFRAPLMQMSWRLWILYQIESLLFGPLLKFWNWPVFRSIKRYFIKF